MKIIEFTGTPKSGKSAIIRDVVNQYAHLQQISAGFRNCPFKNEVGKYYEKQKWAIADLSAHVNAAITGPVKPEIIILDRGFYHVKVMNHFLHWQKNLTRRKIGRASCRERV